MREEERRAVFAVCISAQLHVCNARSLEARFAGGGSRLEVPVRQLLGLVAGKSCRALVYADDTSFHLGKWTDSLSKSFQRDFNSRQRWLLDNKWVLNPKETEAVSYRTDGKLKRMEAYDFA